MKLATAPDHLPVHQFEDEAAFDRWLAQHHLSAQGCWVQVARAKSAFTSITWEGIVDVSLCWGYHAIFPTVASSLLPLLNAVVVPARHAYSHSASLGKRMPVALR